ALDCLTRSAHLRPSREVASCILEAMHRRSDFGMNKRRAIGVVHAGELRGERFQTVECIEIAEKLRHQTLLIDNRLGNTREARVVDETRPCGTPRALQVDHGDLPVSRRWKGTVEFCDRGHFAAPKRDLRLSRPVLNNVDTMTFAARSVRVLA